MLCCQRYTMPRYCVKHIAQKHMYHLPDSMFACEKVKCVKILVSSLALVQHLQKIPGFQIEI